MTSTYHEGVLPDMTETVIYGASDDLIEVEGPIVEEFCGTDFADGTYVCVSTGDVIRFELKPEGWRATIVVNATHPTIGKRPDGVDEDEAVTITAPVAWVVANTVEPARAR